LVKNDYDEESLLVDQNFRYDYVDCLDEGTIIPDQRYAIVSFISPELVGNIHDTLFKVRGYTNNLQKAYQLAKKLEDADNKFYLAVIEIGKWAAVNFKLMKSMKNYDDAKKIEKQKEDFKNLNEIIGRYKKNLDGRKEIMQKRKEEMIKQSATELNENNDEPVPEVKVENDEKESLKDLEKNKEFVKERLRKLIKKEISEKQEETLKPKNSKEKPEIKILNNLNRDRAAMIERMKKKLEEKKKNAENNKQQQNNKQILDEKKIKISQEASRLNEKKQKIEELKEDREKLEANLLRMRIASSRAKT
jgi:hypothetical protein